MADVEDIKVGDLAITVFFSDGIKVLLLPYASERDFVARFILPKLQEAGQSLGVHDVVDIYFEKTQNGTPDISIENGGKRLFLIEAKFRKKIGKLERDIEPRDPAVIDQVSEGHSASF